MALSLEGLLILGIIFTMMIADMTYDGASLVLASQKVGALRRGDARWRTAAAVRGHHDHHRAARRRALRRARGRSGPRRPARSSRCCSTRCRRARSSSLAHVGFWTHSTLVLLFLNLLPHSKHFHVITAIPNVFARSLQPAGRLEPMAENAEKLMEKVGAAGEAPDPLARPVGVARIEHFTWKAILDFYTCTECGRCSDNCPAHRTGKILSPKHLTLALRDHLYAREEEFVARGRRRADATHGHAPRTARRRARLKPVNLVPDVIHPDVLWACTTCRACEEQCPVLISYVDKIVDMRRNLVMVKGEFPHELAKPVPGDGGQRQPVEPVAHGPRGVERRARHRRR